MGCKHWGTQKILPIFILSSRAVDYLPLLMILVCRSIKLGHLTCPSSFRGKIHFFNKEHSNLAFFFLIGKQKISLYGWWRGRKKWDWWPAHLAWVALLLLRYYLWRGTEGCAAASDSSSHISGKMDISEVSVSVTSNTCVPGIVFTQLLVKEIAFISTGK